MSVDVSQNYISLDVPRAVDIRLAWASERHSSAAIAMSATAASTSDVTKVNLQYSKFRTFDESSRRYCVVNRVGRIGFYTSLFTIIW